jgi:two-component system NarL family sensor kinase
VKARGPRPSRRAGLGEIADLRARLAEADETIRAISGGEVDTVMVAGKQGRQLFTLQGAEHAYRALIESMNEGALTLLADQTILYSNRCFAQMVKSPLEQVIGGSFRRFLSVEDRAILRPLMKGGIPAGSKIQVRLNCADGTPLAVQISIRLLGGSGSDRATVGMVVTDLTEARNTEEMLRVLTHRVVQAQETERGRVALELHDHITQQLCAVALHCQVLVAQLAAANKPAQAAAVKIRAMISQTAEEVERISRNLRPSILQQLGLVAVLRETCTDFSKRTGVPVKLVCGALTARQPADTELALYRILQEALQNVEKHGRAAEVTVTLSEQDDFVRLAITDDGAGFDPARRPHSRRRKGGIGLLSMRERAAYVKGVLAIKSGRGAGTEIEVRIPLAQAIAAPRRRK